MSSMRRGDVPPPNEPHPVVIGAGITGLVRALALADRGAAPIIVDPNPPGGAIRSVVEDGNTLECGATTLVATPEVLALLERLGIGDRMLTPTVPRYRQYLWYRGAPHAVPRGPIQVLRSSLLPGMEKLRAVAGLFRKGGARELAAGASVDTLFAGIFSPHIASNLIGPVLRGIFGGDIRRLVASAVFPKLWEHLSQGGSLLGYVKKRKAVGKRAVFRLEGGNGTMITKLVETLGGKATFKSASVTGITKNPATGAFSVSLSTGERLETSAVAVATSGSATAAFIGGISPELAEVEGALRYAPLAVVHLVISRNERLLEDGFGVLFPENGAGLLGILFNTLLFPVTSPPGEAVLTVCFGGVGRRDLIDQSAAVLGEMARAAVRDHLGIHSSKVLRCTCWERGIPQYEERILDLHRAMSAVEAQNPGLIFLGADRGGIGVPARIETALAV